MPLPLALAIPPLLASGALDTAIGGTALAGIAGFLGWEYKDKISRWFGSAPTGINTKPVTFPTKAPVLPSAPVEKKEPLNPSIATVLNPLLDAYKRSLDSTSTVSSVSTALADIANQTKTKNDELILTAGASALLRNQVEAKTSIDEISFALNAQSAVQAMIYETLERNLSLIAGSLVAMTQVANVAPTSTAEAIENSVHVNVQPSSVSIPDYTEYYERLAAHADMAKVVAEHAATERDIHDLDGNVIARTSPMALSAMKEASIAREKTDIINTEIDPSVYLPMSGLPILSFASASGIFSPNYTDPSANPFAHKIIGE